MRWVEKIRMRYQMLLHRGREAGRLESELEFHLEQQIAENQAAGMSAEEARQAALRSFGNPTVLREQARETWGWNGVEALGRDARIGTRTLLRSTGFALTAILVMALGIGANVALFTLVRSVLLRPLPFAEAGRLVGIFEAQSDGSYQDNIVAGGCFGVWKEHAQSFSGMAIDDSMEYNLAGSGNQLPEVVHAETASWNLFPLLGVRPALGRLFTSSDDQPGANATVILSWGLWKRRFGGDPGILNRTIDLDAKPYAVIGVMPAWFQYPSQDIQLWTPIHHEVPAEEMRGRSSHDWDVVGRLRPGVTEAQATSELSLIVRRIHQEHLDDPYISVAANSRPILEDLVGDMRTPLYVLFAATGCLLLIACLNIASLLVARGAARRRELAIRTALGGGRWRLLREHLTESLVLSAVSGGLGLLTAYGILQLVCPCAARDEPRGRDCHRWRVGGICAGARGGLRGVCRVDLFDRSRCRAARSSMRCGMARVRRAKGTAQVRLRKSVAGDGGWADGGAAGRRRACC
jgi:predicted permease